MAGQPRLIEPVRSSMAGQPRSVHFIFIPILFHSIEKHGLVGYKSSRFIHLLSDCLSYDEERFSVETGFNQFDEYQDGKMHPSVC